MIPSVFIDPVYMEEFADNTETEINKENTDKLWKLLTEDLSTFQCDKRCQAPSGFFAGQPWLIPENVLQNKRLGDRTVITWQIWFAGCDSSVSRSYNILHVAEDNTTRVIYEVFNNNTVQTAKGKLPEGMQAFEESDEKFKSIKLLVELTEEHHYGSYYVENDKGRSELGQVKKMVDGEWQEWSSFGSCSKTCVPCLEQPGLKQRRRTCKPPQNGGQPCHGKSTEEKTCARYLSKENKMYLSKMLKRAYN